MSELSVRIAATCVTLGLVACSPGSTTSTTPTTATTSDNTAAPTTAAPPTTASGPTTDWANFEYRSAECGSFTPITLTNGEFTNQESAVSVTLAQSVLLDSGETLVALNCFAGPSGDTRSTELLLFGPGASEVAYEKLPAGELALEPDGTGTLTYDVYAPGDPRCCPSGTDEMLIAIMDGTILIAMP